MKKAQLILTILIISFLINHQVYSAEITPPEILIYSKTYIAGEEILYLEGKALPNSIVILSLKKDGSYLRSWEVFSDKEGNWTFSTNELLKPGDYLISARTKDQQGMISNFSSEYNVKVILAGLSIGPWIIAYQGLFLILIILVFMFSIFSIYLILSKIRRDKLRIRKETKEAAESLKNTFSNIREDLEKRIEYFDSRPGLSSEERRIRDEIMIILRSAEEQIRKEIKDIEKELE